jgi:hypothetical protein
MADEDDFPDVLRSIRDGAPESTHCVAIDAEGKMSIVPLDPGSSIVLNSVFSGSKRECELYVDFNAG